MKKLKVNYYDSLMTKENNFDPHQVWTMSRAWSPKRMHWIYGGGLQPCAAEPMTKLPEEGIDVTLFTDKDLLSPMVDEVNTPYKVVYLSECRSIHPFAYQHAVMVEDKFDHIFTHDEDLLKRGPKYVKNVLGTSWVSVFSNLFNNSISTVLFFSNTFPSIFLKLLFVISFLIL